MQPQVTVRQLEGKKLLGVARHHAVITDRRREDAGSDLGCTSGELLLLAIGSCVAGSLRNFFEAKGQCSGELKVDVGLETSAVAAARDRIVIALYPGAALLDVATDEELRLAAVAGGVASRLRTGSEVEVRIVRATTGV
jgi:uncharacterized OsmC-like protein